jgi:hypothetical protein
MDEREARTTVLLLRAAADEICRRGWNGYITPEHVSKIGWGRGKGTGNGTESVLLLPHHRNGKSQNPVRMNYEMRGDLKCGWRKFRCLAG